MGSPVRALVAVLLSAVLVSACARGEARSAETVVVGVGSTVEQRVLAALTVAAFEDAGVATEVVGDLGGTVGLRRAALRGTVDVFWDYSGAAWALGLGNHAPPADATESVERVRRADEDNDLTWLEPSSANATLALFVRAADLPPASEPRGMGWLAGVLSAGAGSLCADEDFVERPGGLDALADAYAIDLRTLEVVAAGEQEAVEAVAQGRCFAGLASATSGQAERADLVPVSDDLGVFPAFIVAPVARAGLSVRVPEAGAALARISARLDTRTLAALNAAAEAGSAPEDLAADFFAAPPEG